MGASVAVHVAAIGLLCIIARLAPLRPAEPELAVPVIFVPAQSALPPGEALVLTPSVLTVGKLVETNALVSLPPVFVHGMLPARKPHSREAAASAHPTAKTSVLHIPARIAEPAAATTGSHAPPATPPSAVSAQAALAGFTQGVHRAVQQVAAYPAAARLQHRQGRTQLRFDYDEGTVSDEAVVVSSQSASLDGAALQAVRRAAIPRPAPPLGPHMHGLLVWVDFELAYD